jgi:hypothetical protein
VTEGFGETRRLLGAHPPFREPLAVKDPQKQRDEEQESLIKRARDRKQPYYGKPA